MNDKIGIGGKDSFVVSWGDNPPDILSIAPDVDGNIEFYSEKVRLRLPRDTMRQLFEWLDSWGYI